MTLSCVLAYVETAPIDAQCALPRDPDEMTTPHSLRRLAASQSQQRRRASNSQAAQMLRAGMHEHSRDWSVEAVQSEGRYAPDRRYAGRAEQQG